MMPAMTSGTSISRSRLYSIINTFARAGKAGSYRNASGLTPWFHKSLKRPSRCGTGSYR